ncbi:ribbon-helix-helix domain-containing protein [Methanorbis furvi]|uniref:Ribbon-helix-helix protein CopG domain-containing protein n=1 Tax=Methanorbis furvi TaxID=3028299 RepID=A0AAE4MDU0_9EURY|nr:hypothetical protein [Methanocorpusculaceae archaeon Ag1]
MAKVEMIGIRVPTDLLDKINALKDAEGVDRTAIILRALRYWVSIEGKVTTDNEYLNRITSIDQNVTEVALGVKNMQELKDLVMEQQKTINTLLRLIPKEE